MSENLSSRISGGNDKQGFPMMPGVMNRNRVRILFRPGMKCYRPRRDGCMKRKSVRGAIVGPYLSALNLVIVKKGEQEIEPLTTVSIPNVCQPKRAYRIRKMWNLPRDADPRPYLIKREVKNKAGEVIKVKVPKVQRLMTEQKLARKAKKEAKRRANLLLNRTRRKDYAEFKTKLLAERKAAAETATC